MKRTLLLILSVMAFAGISVAQDVYTSGARLNSYGTHDAVVYKNGEVLYSIGSSNSEESFQAKDVLYLNGDVYWVDNHYVNHVSDYGDVFKNDERFLSTPIGSGGFIQRLFTDGSNIYAAGFKIIDHKRYPTVWKNDDPEPYLFIDNVECPDIYVYDGVVVDDIVYICGYISCEEMTTGVVWTEGEEVFLEFGENKPTGMAFYNNDFYFSLSGIFNPISMVYKNSLELYTLTTNGNVHSISMDAGDIYVAGSDNDSAKIWKNGEPLYEYSGYVDRIKANSEGVYYVGTIDEHGQVWKDGTPLYTLDRNIELSGISVDLSCQDNTPLSLPFYDGFETDATQWTCWHIFDNDNHNYGEASYWHRGGMNQDIYPATGNHCAWHRYNSDNSQEGWLITPYLQLPTGGNITLTFKTYEQYPSDYTHESVWVGTEDNEYEVWVQNDPSSDWNTVTIDLSDYQGQMVVVGFLYQGEDAHSWYIDDVSIVQTEGVEENQDGCLAVCPNPANESIHILGIEANSQIEIYSSIGELVKTANVNANQEIGIGELSAGLYLVRCGNATMRFVKK